LEAFLATTQRSLVLMTLQRDAVFKIHPVMNLVNLFRSTA